MLPLIQKLAPITAVTGMAKAFDPASNSSEGANSSNNLGNTRLLNLMRLSSPALPVGAYAYSQGLESAINEGIVVDADSAGDWLRGVFEYGFASLDLPVLKRLYQSWIDEDYESILHWNRFLLANRETQELAAEELQIGAAMRRLLNSLDVEQPGIWDEEKPGFCCQFAFAGCTWGIEIDELASAYAFAWLENQVGIATKLVPLGQSAAQKMLSELLPNIVDAIEFEFEDHEIGQSLMGLAILSSWHKAQPARLFRS